MADRPRRPTRRAGALALVAALLLVTGCGSDAADPDAERLERIEARLDSSFSDAQAECVLDRLDDAELEALDRGKALPAEGTALDGYTEAVTACVTDGRPTSTTVPATTTTAPGTTTTTAGG